MVEGIKAKSTDFDWFWRKLDSYLQDQDLKQTRQRKVIVERLLQMKSHVSAEDLYDEIRRDHPHVGLATIYRTLNLLKDAGLVEEQSFADGKVLFEIDTPGTHHDHLICVHCGRVVEFENPTIEALQQQVAKEHGFVLTSHRLDLYGRCAAGCQNLPVDK